MSSEEEEEVFIEAAAVVGIGATAAECTLWVVDHLISHVRITHYHTHSRYLQRERERERKRMRFLAPNVRVRFLLSLSLAKTPQR
jgi:hypothetical protein